MAASTLRLFFDPENPEHTADSIAQAAAILRRGGTVAFPTETVYGLGANALDPMAVARIFEAKRRPAWDPLIVHIADRAALPGLVKTIPEAAERWMEQFWPGPLTLLLEKHARVPDAVTAGRPRVGVRVPKHAGAQALLRAAGVPVAAPSANLFGHVSPTTAAHVLADLDGRIDAVLDGGPCEHGVESTVVDAAADPCILYRPGAISLEQLAAVWPRIEAYRELAAAESQSPASLPSPGVGIRHYAPRARVVLIEHGPEQAERLRHALVQLSGAGRIGLLLPQGLAPALVPPPTAVVFEWGCWSQPETMANSLFAGLRHLDAAAMACIVCPLPAPTGIGRAIGDRLRKAARSV